VIERALALVEGGRLDDDRPGDDLPRGEGSASRGEPDVLLEPSARARGSTSEAAHGGATAAGGVHKEAARLLGIDPRNFNYFLRKHGLEPTLELEDDGEPPA